MTPSPRPPRSRRSNPFRSGEPDGAAKRTLLPVALGVGAVVTALVGLVVVLSTVNLADTAANEIGLHYGGGLVEDKAYKGIVPVGTTNQLIGPGDTVYRYPIDQRSYIIGGGGADTAADDEVTVVSQDNVRLGVRVQVYFTLNREPEVLRQFHERIGLKTSAYVPVGWDRMLAQYFRPQIDRSLAAVAADYGWQALYNDEAKKIEFQNAAAKEFSRLLPQAVGGDYFCGPAYTGGKGCGELSFTVQKPTPLDEAIIQGVEAKQQADLATQAQQQKNVQVQTELESIREQVALLGQNGYILKKAIESGKVQLMVVPDGADVSVPVPVPQP